MGVEPFSRAKLPIAPFDPLESAPASLRLEFSGGPLEYGSAPVVLDLKDIKFKTVDNKYVRDYQLAWLK